MGVQGVRQPVTSWGDPIANLNKQIQDLLRPPAPVFQPATLLNGWVNYGAGYAVPGWWTLGCEVVLQGTVKSGVGGFFTTSIPPADGARHRFYVDNAGGTPAEIDVDGSGNVLFMFGTNGFVSLDGIRYVAT